MSKSQELLDEFKSYADDAIRRHEPTAHKSYRPRSIERVKTLLTEISKKVQSYSNDITKQANVILEKGESDKEIDSVRLKADLIEEGKKATSKFISTYKPK